MLTRFIRYLLIMFLCYYSIALAKEIEPINVNATITATAISFEPSSIPENTPFIIHVINKSGVPVELENSDTSVEVYAGTDKTFKIGLSAGKYKFFNDFNPKTKTADLIVLTVAQMANYNKNITEPNAILEQIEVPIKQRGTTLKVSQAQRETHIVVSNTNEYTLIDNKLTATPSDGVDNSTSLLDVTFIMWRESIEALLVVGIVFSWLKQLKSGQREGMLFLAAGIAIGLLWAIILGYILIKLSGKLSGNSQEYLQAGLTFLAALMIVYMVKWMRSNGAKLKSEMYNTLAQNQALRWNISILFVVAIAIAREGSEAVIFIYALGFGEHGKVSISMMGAVIIGLLLAILTIYILSMGNKIFSWRYFFKVTEIILLLLGGAMLLNCIDILVAAGILPILKAKFWDTSFILSDGGHFVPLLSSVIGYRATPSLIDIIAYLFYWIGVLWFIKYTPHPLKPGLRRNL